MSIDDGLRPLLRKHTPQFHWTSIETGATTEGVADSNYLSKDGVEGWVESKATRGGGYLPKFRTSQISWLLHRARLGGRAWIAVRRRHRGGPRLGAPVDELWMVHAALVRELASGGLGSVVELKIPHSIWRWPGGPTSWDWDTVAGLLVAPARVVLARPGSPPEEPEEEPGRAGRHNPAGGRGGAGRAALRRALAGR